MLAVAFLTAPFLSAQEEAPAAKAEKPFSVILKLDDLNGYKGELGRWQKLRDFAVERQLKLSIGIICNSLEGEGKESYYAWIKEFQQTGLVEFWNHGYDHLAWKDEAGKQFWEFKGPSYEQQKDHLVRSQQLAKDKLGITFRAFGPPFNLTDAATLKALSEDPDLQIFLYGQPQTASATPHLLILDHTDLTIEEPTFVPNPAKVEGAYAKLVGSRDCFVMQGHPGKWDDARFANFVAIVDFLTAKGARFITPSEYLESRAGGTKAATP
ncbi:Peptidoglycan/xylan/chitin deacetylase, PgdA/CDA1 family [Verrucomicrobium sp. GAS474]|nr:Peptidoglycan/xylan/chitin deacetylase, PgdA/CDA1 family [Verrucomicrobium sp. GAS474]